MSDDLATLRAWLTLIGEDRLLRLHNEATDDMSDEQSEALWLDFRAAWRRRETTS